jgi:hypothetical protein
MTLTIIGCTNNIDQLGKIIVPQTILSVVLEVVPESAGRLSGLIDKVNRHEDGLRPPYSRVKDGVPTLHFMSMSVFQDSHYDPIFVIEANFDGNPGPFWAQLEETLGTELREMLRCCKRPFDQDGPLYDAVTTAEFDYPIAPYLERRTLIPSVSHQGNRGLDRIRVMQEGDLFQAIRAELASAAPGTADPYRGIDAGRIHRKLRAALLSRFPWLGQPPQPRVSASERVADLLRLTGFLLAVLYVLSIPGFLFLVFLRAFFQSWFDRPFVALLIVPTLLGIMIYNMHAARRGEAVPTRSGGLTLDSLSLESKATSFTNPITLAIGVALYLAVLVILIASVNTLVLAALSAAWQAPTAFIPAFMREVGVFWSPMVRAAIVGLYTALVVSLPALIVWLRWLERRDSHQDAPAIDPRELRKMMQLEDQIPQNHMGSVVIVKPGVLRTALFRTGHLGLTLVLRVLATDGYLGSMRTVHFAHWAFVNNGSRLMFFSNFDHSWDSYLDDFIEKAHGGLTLAWGSCTGFPPTRFLVLDGASHGRQFKAWARNSMSVSRFWFSAYPNLTVNQIERNSRIADGLRAVDLASDAAAGWVRDL